MGWFFGFKLHVVMNHKGEIMAIRVTPGNTDDRAVFDAMTAELKSKVLADVISETCARVGYSIDSA